MGVTYVTWKRLDIPLYAWYDGVTKSGTARESLESVTRVTQERLDKVWNTC